MNKTELTKPPFTVLVENYLKENLIPTDSTGFRYLVLLICRNISNPNCVGLTVSTMISELSPFLGVTETAVRYHLRRTIVIANENRASKDLPPFSLASFLRTAFVELSGYQD